MDREEGEEPEVHLDQWRIDAAGGTTFAFSSPSEVNAYLTAERTKWAWTKAINDGQAARLFRNLLTAMVAAIEESKAPTFSLGESGNSKVEEALRTYLTFEPPIHDRSPLQAFLLAIRERDQSEAAAALCWLLRLHGRVKSVELAGLSQVSVAAGIADAALWHSGCVTEARSAGYLDLLNRMALQAAEFRDRTSALSVEAGSARDSTKAAYADVQRTAARLTAELAEHADTIRAEANTRADELQKSLSEKVQGLIQNLGDDWKRLTATYDTQLGLSAPAKYWKGKGIDHAMRAKTFGRAAAWWAVIGAGLLWVVYHYLFGGLLLSQIPTWGQVLPTTVTALLYLWGLKTLIRLTLSHIHLGLDADERRIMILSYLAISRKKDVSDQERIALFAAIFRPTGNGIIKDENPPFPLWEALRGSRGTSP